MCGERKCITFLTELDRVNNKHQVRGITLSYRMLRCGTMRIVVTSESGEWREKQGGEWGSSDAPMSQTRNNGLKNGI